MVRVLILSIALVSIVAPTAQAQIFWELVGQTQGPIEGDATYPGEEGRIRVDSLNFGFLSTGTLGGQPGKVNVTSVSGSKRWDEASINLVAALGTLEPLDTCIFRIYPAGTPFATDSAGDLSRRMPQPYELKIELLGARLEVYSTAGAGIVPSESFSLVFEEIRIEHGPTPETFTWTIPVLPRDAASALAMDRSTARSTVDPFTFAVTDEGAGAIEVTDVDGRVVRLLGPIDRAVANETIVWDATDDSGRRVAPGVYVATQRVDDRVITRRIVVGE